MSRVPRDGRLQKGWQGRKPGWCQHRGDGLWSSGGALGQDPRGLRLAPLGPLCPGQPQSHKGQGWEILTDRIISAMNEKTTPVVFMLWGGNARAKRSLITNPLHLVLECAHPSPLSAYNGFFGCKHFSKTNEILLSRGQTPIDWSIS